MRYTFVLPTLCLVAALTLAAERVSAQTPALLFEQLTAEREVVYLVQGERRQLSRDFVAELNGDQLTISLQSSGLMRATATDELLVSLIQPTGERQDLRPDARGNIVFDNVRQGLAAVLVTADSFANTSVASAYAAIPFFVSSPSLPAQADQPAAPVQPLQVPLVEVIPEQLAADLEQTVTVSTSGGNEVLASSDYDIVPASRFRVQRTEDGSVQGRVVVPQRGYETLPGVTQVSFFQGSTVVSSTRTTPEGLFVAPAVPAGMLGVVAVGPSGHAAYMVDVVEFQAAENVDAVSRNGESQTHFVSMQPQAGRELIILLIPPAMMDQVLELLNSRLGGAAAPMAPPGPPMAGFGGGGFGGGSGGGSGGGGMGGIGALAALAAIPAVFAALDDDDDFLDPRLATRIAPPAFVPGR